MLRREYPTQNPLRRVRAAGVRTAGDLIGWTHGKARDMATIGPTSRRARPFGTFGFGAAICAPLDTLVNPQAIHLGAGTLIASHAVLSAGWIPDQVDLPERVIVIGERCLIGRGSSIVAHRSIVIGDDVWTGHHVHITDMNHGYEDPDIPISQQWMTESPVSIGSGSWLGHGAIVLPGAQIGRHCVVGANSVVTGDIPDHSVAVGAPARVIRRVGPGDHPHLRGGSAASTAAGTAADTATVTN